MIERTGHHLQFHRRDRDLIERLQDVWDPSRFHCKIKSQKLEDATNRKQLLDIQGNAFADNAAVKTRQLDDIEFQELCQQIRQHYIDQTHMFDHLCAYLLDIAYARMLKDAEDIPTKQDPLGHSDPHRSQRDNSQFQQHMAKLKNWSFFRRGLPDATRTP